jgi:hypothetical protein
MKAMERRSPGWGSVTGLLIGVQFLAGHSQVSLFTLSLIGVFSLYHIFLTRKDITSARKGIRVLFIFLLMALLILMVCLIQLVPTYEYSELTDKSGGMDYDFATSFSLPPVFLISTFIPNFFGNPVNGTYWYTDFFWEYYFYFGVITVMLLVLSLHFRKDRYYRFFLWLGIGASVLTLGRNLPVYWVIWKFVPGFDLFRVPPRFLWFSMLSVSILSGFGFQYLQDDLTERVRKRMTMVAKMVIGLTVILSIISILLTLLGGEIIPLLRNILSSLMGNERLLSDPGSYWSIVRDLMVLAGFISLSGILLQWRSISKRTRNGFNLTVISLIMVNLLMYHLPFVDVKDIDEIYSRPDYIRFLQDNSDGHRVYDASDLILDNNQIFYGIYTLDGYNPMEIQHFKDLLGPVEDQSNRTDNPILDILDVRYVLLDRIIEESGLELVMVSEDDRGVFVYENYGNLGLAFIVHKKIPMDQKRILERMQRVDFDPLNGVLMNGKDDGTGDEDSASQVNETLTITERDHDRLSLNVYLETPGYIILSQTYYPTWSVFVDGDREQIVRTYYTLMGVYVKAGYHNVDFKVNLLTAAI